MGDGVEPIDIALNGRRIVLGVSGGIAAYKAVELCRRLVDAGVFVSPVMTAGAQHFVGRTTLSALASEPVRTELWDAAEPIPHTRLGQNCDAIVIAPATARIISAYAHGLSTDLLTNTLLATRAPVVVCPAMHTEMWEHPSVVDNIDLLRSRGVVVVDPEDGRLAGGDRGAGRLASTDAIMSAVRTLFAAQDLSGRTVVVSAGGTREPIDAVRVIANRSTGRQGYAVARAAARRGATVHLVSTVSLPAPAGVEVVEVETAAEMQASLERLAPAADVVVMAAAVADFTPVAPVEHKLKKSDGVPRIELVPTPDILAGLGATKQPGQVLVGFAAETERLETHAMAKLEAKGADLIVANDVSAPGVGFGHDTNAVTIFGHGRAPQAVALADKARIADVILDRVVELFGERA